MVKATVTLTDGQQVTLLAPDMLNAMWMADSRYHSMATEMHFERVEVSKTDGGCEVDQTGDGAS